MRINHLFESFVEWRQVPGWPKYEVSNDGRVRVASTGSRVAQWDHTGKNTTYKRVTLRDQGRRVNARVHRLVAMAFIPNPHNLPEVDHKDTNPFNNHVNNLEWVTSEENLARRRPSIIGRRQRAA